MPVISQALKPTPFKLIMVALLSPLLVFLRVYCEPNLIMGGAIMPNGEVGGGLTYNCGAFSQWLWDTPGTLLGYIQLRGWRLVLVAVVITVLWSVGYELVYAHKQLPPRQQRLTWGKAVGIVSVVFIVFLLAFAVGLPL